ncbi:MAG: hydrogenase maturation protease [Gammaproteobacteria bacterium]
MIKPLLLIGYGNPGRGDDALGPELLDYLHNRQTPLPDSIELLSDFQLQIEHILDLQGRQRLVFADASLSCPSPYAFETLQAACDNSYSTHALSPAALLHVYRSVLKAEPPPAFVLSIRGERFAPGHPLSAAARQNLTRAGRFIQGWLARQTFSL